MITRKAEYAIRILFDLAALQKEGKNTTTKEIAKRQKVPSNLIMQLIAVLGKKGWLKTTRGPAGGVQLIKDPEKITLQEVIELFDGPLIITRCLENDSSCENSPDCPLRKIWLETQQKMLDVLKGTNIKELLEKIESAKG
ncbi:MAG: Rrf2 family transcriptional regulator [Firmicutes bacterium]|nr:Rrf2 family transcriptional regulator [Bacillota bacterium]